MEKFDESLPASILHFLRGRSAGVHWLQALVHSGSANWGDLGEYMFSDEVPGNWRIKDLNRPKYSFCIKILTGSFKLGSKCTCDMWRHTKPQKTALLQTSKWQDAYTVSWCFEPNQPQRITSGLRTNFNLSPCYSFHMSLYCKSLLSQSTLKLSTIVQTKHLKKIFFLKPISIPWVLNMGTCIQHGDLFYSAGLHRNLWTSQS